MELIIKMKTLLKPMKSINKIMIIKKKKSNNENYLRYFTISQKGNEP